MVQVKVRLAYFTSSFNSLYISYDVFIVPKTSMLFTSMSKLVMSLFGSLQPKSEILHLVCKFITVWPYIVEVVFCMYRSVVWVHGSGDGAVCFTDRAKSSRWQNDTDITHFKGTIEHSSNPGIARGCFWWPLCYCMGQFIFQVHHFILSIVVLMLVLHSYRIFAKDLFYCIYTESSDGISQFNANNSCWSTMWH